MNKYTMITKEALEKLLKCFVNAEEFETFISQMDKTISEINFMEMLRNRVSDNDCVHVLIRQVCFFILFCRENLDLIHQLIRTLESKEISEDELKEIRGL